MKISAIRTSLGSDKWGELQWDRLNRFQLMKNDRNQVHFCHCTLFLNVRNVHAYRTNSLSKAGTLITQQSGGSPLASRGFRYSVRIATEPDIVTMCGTPAGIHTARWGGTTHVPSRLRTVITPREA